MNIKISFEIKSNRLVIDVETLNELLTVFELFVAV
jgi:hypothetical protein